MSKLVRRNMRTRAKGSVIGRASRMVIGWTKLSNWAARTMYMKMKLSTKAMPKLCCDSPMIFAWPANSQ